MCPEAEYPDNAGYPDGMGFLDEGTAALADPSSVAAELDAPSADIDDDVAVVSDRDAYRAVVGGMDVAVMRVARVGSTVTIRSTVVDPAVRGRGVATGLIAHVLDELRDERAAVIVECREVARFIELHPEYADLVT